MPRRVYTSGPDGSRSVAPGECARCHADPCRCEPRASASPAAQRVRVRLERAGRGGKTVTVCSPLVLARGDAEGLLRDLRRACATGGALRLVSRADGNPAFSLELQGDHVHLALEHLRTLGFGAAAAG